MDILIEYGYREDDVKAFPIEQLARFVILSEGKPDTSEVSITFVDDAEMAELQRTLSREGGRPTCCRLNATTSMTASPPPASRRTSYELGDIVIAVDVAERQTREFATTLEGEISLLVTHGLLHLCGYDHVEDDEAEIMEARERELLTAWADAGHEATRGIREPCAYSAAPAGRIRWPDGKTTKRLETNSARAGDDRDAGRTRLLLAPCVHVRGEGIRYAFASQRNLKIHVAFAAVAVALGFALGISQAGWPPSSLCIAMVMSLEVLNTAVESVVVWCSRVEPARKACEGTAPRARSTRLLRLDRRRLRGLPARPRLPLGSFVAKTLRRRFKAPISRIISQNMHIDARTCDGAMSIDRCPCMDLDAFFRGKPSTGPDRPLSFRGLRRAS